MDPSLQSMDTLENYMSPWVYRLVLSQVKKSYDDSVAVSSFLQLCNHSILLTKT